MTGSYGADQQQSAWAGLDLGCMTGKWQCLHGPRYFFCQNFSEKVNFILNGGLNLYWFYSLPTYKIVQVYILAVHVTYFWDVQKNKKTDDNAKRFYVLLLTKKTFFISVQFVFFYFFTFLHFLYFLRFFLSIVFKFTLYLSIKFHGFKFNYTNVHNFHLLLL